MTRRAEPKRKQPIGSTIPNYVRSIMLFQFSLVLILSGWLYLEYTHNVYLQSYVKSYLQTNPTIFQAGIPGVLAGAAGAMYAKLRRTNKELAAVEKQVEREAPLTNGLFTVLAQLPQLEVGALPPERVIGRERFRSLGEEAGRLSRVRSGEKTPYRDDQPVES